MPQVSTELVFAEQGTPQRRQYRFIKVDYLAALLTDQMMVVSFTGGVISRPTSPKVGLGDQTKSLEQFQGAING